MFQKIKDWWNQKRETTFSEHISKQEAILRGMEFGIGQLQLKCEDLSMIAGALLLSTGQTEYIIKQDFIQTFLSNNMEVVYEMDENNNLKVFLESIEDDNAD